VTKRDLLTLIRRGYVYATMQRRGERIVCAPFSSCSPRLLHLGVAKVETAIRSSSDVTSGSVTEAATARATSIGRWTQLSRLAHVSASR
jgi:hypothetical protein